MLFDVDASECKTIYGINLMPYSYVFLSLIFYMVIDYYIFEILTVIFHVKTTFRNILHFCLPCVFKEYNVYWRHDDVERDDEYILENKMTLEAFLARLKYPLPGLQPKSKVQTLYFYLQMAYLIFNFVYVWVYTEDGEGWERYQVAYGRFVNGVAGNIIANFLGIMLMVDHDARFRDQFQKDFESPREIQLHSRSHGYNRLCHLSSAEKIKENYGSNFNLVFETDETPMANMENGAKPALHCNRCLQPIQMEYFKGANCGCVLCTNCVPRELGPARRRTKLAWALVLVYPAIMTHCIAGMFAYLWVLVCFGISVLLGSIILLWFFRIAFAIPRVCCVLLLPLKYDIEARMWYDDNCPGAYGFASMEISYVATRIFASFLGFLIIQQSYNYAYLLYSGHGYLHAITAEASLRTSQCYYFHLFDDFQSYLQFFNWV